MLYGTVCDFIVLNLVGGVFVDSTRTHKKVRYKRHFKHAMLATIIKRFYANWCIIAFAWRLLVIASLNAYSKLITYALHKLVRSALHTWDDTCIWSKDTLPLYVFLEFLAIFQHKKCYWHRDITFYSPNCVHTHRSRSRQLTSAPRSKQELMWFLQLASQREHANRVKTSSATIKVILCYYFCFCMSYERAMLHACAVYMPFIRRYFE